MAGNLTVNASAGFNCAITQVGADPFTLVAGAGKTLRSLDDATDSPGQWGVVSVYVRDNGTDIVAAGVA